MRKAIIFALLVLGAAGCRKAPPPATEAGGPEIVTTPTPPPITAPTPDAAVLPPEKVLETKIIKGTFSGFEGTDYRQAVIELESGEFDNYFLANDEALLYFLASHIDKPLEFTYQVVAREIAGQRGGGTGQAEKLVATKDANGVTQETWWQQQKAANPDEAALRQKLNKLVTEATLKDGER